MDSTLLVLGVLFAGIIFGFYTLAMKVNSPPPGVMRRARAQQRQREQALPVVEAIPYARARVDNGWSDWAPIERSDGRDA
ncbi:MAG TPA: hypothetical protein VK762_37525, partial [Polyangiaceae bacterium]|nr:hypothetical protein [Polyangiaceae bacterium]